MILRDLNTFKYSYLFIVVIFYLHIVPMNSGRKYYDKINIFLKLIPLF